MVRNARILLSQVDHQEALTLLRRVVSMTKDTRGADKAARKILQELGQP